MMKRHGFTLTELMISIALALLLIAGVSRVFTLTSDTISAGQAISDRTRQEQSIYGVLKDDLRHTVHDAPFLAIVSGVTQSHLTREEYENNEPAATYRTDRLITFTRYTHRRQTGNDGTLIAPQGGSEWYVWLGHPMIGGQALGAGDPQSNPDNYFASSWRLARMAILLDPGHGGQILDANDAPQRHWSESPAAPMSPLSFDTRSDDGSHALPSARYDVARTTIGDYRAKVQHAAEADADWWQQVCGIRFDATPYVARPLDSASIAATTPLLAQHVSEFVVEFAGDWITQDADGNIVALEPDGVMDFSADAEGIRSVRWYGLARDVDGDGTPDVIPLGTLAGAAAPFEKVNTPDEYVVVWGDSLLPRPRMIRLVIRQSDPQGRLAADGVMEIVSPIQ